MDSTPPSLSPQVEEMLPTTMLPVANMLLTSSLFFMASSTLEELDDLPLSLDFFDAVPSPLSSIHPSVRGL